MFPKSVHSITDDSVLGNPIIFESSGKPKNHFLSNESFSIVSNTSLSCSDSLERRIVERTESNSGLSFVQLSITAHIATY